MTEWISWKASRLLFQSTLPQGKWRQEIGDVLGLLYISIHTSTREVTVPIIKHPIQCCISIHTSTREVTSINMPKRLETNKFQSTLPQGKWPDYLCTTWFQVNFNPHFHKGSDVGGLLWYVQWWQFQSTLPQGKWPEVISDKSDLYQFQSTLPQGKWRNGWDLTWSHLLFQSTLPQGKWL